MNILFVNPNFHSGGPEIIVGTVPPLGLLSVAGALKSNGYNKLSLLDLAKTKNNEKVLIEKIEKSNIDTIFIGGMAATASLNQSLKSASLIKEINNDIDIILGGTHASFMYEEIMRRNDSIDYIIRGEGEETSVKLIDAINNGEDLKKINNLVYKENNKIIVTDTKESIVNLDDYTPAYDIIPDWELYRAPTNNEITTTVQFSRGCNHQCNFCGQWMFWHKWHSKSIDKFIDEIKMLNKKYGVTFFIWADENPAQYQDKWIKLLKSMKEINTKGNLHHMLDTRIDHIIRDKKFLNLYKEAGIFSIYLGMESVSQQRLDYFNKETTIEMNKKTLELLRKHEIVSIVQLLIGLPEENKESMIQNATLLKKWEPDLAHFYFLTPLPWTSFGKSMEDNIIEYNWEKWDYRHPIVKLNEIDQNKLIKLSKKIKLEFNFNPEKVAKVLSIKDTYRRNFIVNSLIQSLKQRSGQNENSKLQ